MKVDIVAFGAHPDDVELGCAGTLLTHIAQGKKAVIIDLTRGELGTRGTPALRFKEAKKAAKILGVSERDNLGFADGFFVNDATHQLSVIQKIRQYKPKIVLLPAPTDRHPDHGRAAQLISDSCFLAGLSKITTLSRKGRSQKTWRPKAVYHYIQDKPLKATFVVDISKHMATKMKAVRAFGSQFYNPKYKTAEGATYISDKLFFDRLYHRASEMGRACGFTYAEGFISQRTIGVTNMFAIL